MYQDQDVVRLVKIKMDDGYGDTQGEVTGTYTANKVQVMTMCLNETIVAAKVRILDKSIPSVITFQIYDFTWINQLEDYK